MAVVVAVLVVAAGITLYIDKLLRSPTPEAAVRSGPSQADLVLGTTPAVGKLGGNPSWVSYLVRQNGQWKHTTVFKVPANSMVRVTIYNFDGESGLRNPFLSQVQGTQGGVMQINGKSETSIDPDAASHTFTVPQMGIVVPIPGVADDAPNQCEEMPCSLSQAHQTVTFVMRTGKKGRYRWQCFVPCAAGFETGFGGPMQTIGYMDGFVQVV
ncbi:MAG: hypothetical protein WB771_12520 [Solirubrobacterales bacterium]